MLRRKIIPTIFLSSGIFTIANADPIQMIDFDGPASAPVAAAGYAQIINFNQRPSQLSMAQTTNNGPSSSDLKMTPVSSKMPHNQGFTDEFAYLNIDAHSQSQTLMEASQDLPLDSLAATKQTALRFTGDARLERASITEHEFSELFTALVQTESNFDHRVISSKGAIGLTQLMPSTAIMLGVDPYSIEQNLYGGAEYLLRQIENFGDLELALAAYNAGPGAVVRYNAIPPFAETETYIARIKSNGADSLIETVQQRQLAASRATQVPLMTGPISPPSQPLITHYKEG